MFTRTGEPAVVIASLLISVVALALAISVGVWYAGLIEDARWALDYHTALVAIAGLEIGDGTMILTISLALLYYKQGGVREVLKVIAGITVAACFVPLVGIRLAIWLTASGIEETHIRIFSCAVFLLLAWMAFQGGRGVEENNWWTRLMKRVQEWLQEHAGAFATSGVLFFSLEIPDKTGIGTGGMQLIGLIPSANAVGSTNALILVNYAGIAAVLLLGAFKEEWVRWFGYVSAAGFLLGAIYMGWTAF